jgi:hypothetical protein
MRHVVAMHMSQLHFPVKKLHTLPAVVTGGDSRPATDFAHD